MLRRVYFKKLKSLNDVEISFSDTLTAIMGVNGAGKTTVIHALACLYRPSKQGRGEDHKFPEFFVPNTDALWNGSELTAYYTVGGKEETEELSKSYSKPLDRWTPKYESRPRREVYYLGIETCLPDIEKKNKTSRILYKSELREDRLSCEIRKNAAAILNKPYESLLDNTYLKQHFSGVGLSNGLKYSSLSMGSGEQRVLKILETVLSASYYSLVLIDEIDLLLHVLALKELILRLSDIAHERHLQIIFTTHSLEMLELQQYVSIRYIENFVTVEKTNVYESMTPELVYRMSGHHNEQLSIFVEDVLAECIINRILKKNHMFTNASIIKFGSIENAFAIATFLMIHNEDREKNLIVLDGDRYTTHEEKIAEMKRKLSGTEQGSGEKRERALSYVTEFCLPKGVAPEKFLFDIILKYFPEESEIYRSARNISATIDSHQWLTLIIDETGYSLDDIICDVFCYADESSELKEYIKPIEEWLGNS